MRTSTGCAHAGAALRSAWKRLHRGDCEPWPDATRLGRLARGGDDSVADLIAERGGAAALAAALQDAWRAFHEGRFAEATEAGAALGALGAAVANKAAGVHAAYVESNERRAVALLERAVERGREAAKALPGEANSHYMLAFVLGRLSQRISVVKALAAGHAGEVKRALDRTLEIESRHADAHIALGLYHAEILAKVGAIAGRLGYGVSAEAAVKHFERALALDPESPVAHVEFAAGLLLLDERGNRERARELFTHAVEIQPADAMEKLDVARARAMLARLRKK